MVSHPALPLDISQRSIPVMFGVNQHQMQQQINHHQQFNNQPNQFMMRNMEFAAAQESFMSMMSQFQQQEVKHAFLQWIEATFIRPGGTNNNGAVTNGVSSPMNNDSSNPVGGIPCGGGSGINGLPNGVGASLATDYAADSKLRRIADDLREQMPLNAIMPSEQITFPSVGENADCDPSHTLHVDSFLYDEDLIDELCDTGELGRNYCLDCSSHNTQPITYISHSASRERLSYIFRALLPPIPEDAVFLDIGSRLGAVLYGAHVYTKCKRLVGIELNEELCVIQQRIVNKYNFQDRINIVAGDVQNHGNIVEAADVIVLNNVFEFFMTPELQARVWSFMRATCKRGCYLVTIPALQDTLQHLPLSWTLAEWVREVSPHDPNVIAPFDFQSETSDVKLYQVL